VEAVNALAAIRRIVYEQKRYSLAQVYTACKNNFEGEGEELLRVLLWNCPKWGNDDDAVDGIAVDLFEFALRECKQYKTYLGGQVLGGIHQPHPVPTGKGLMATPEGRKCGMPVSVTLSPESGTMKNGPTAALSSAAKIDPMLVQSVCEEKGYYDVSVPIRDYDTDFIEGCLIEAWDKVNGLIQDKISGLPF
jgi:formate C-acetyltransferase